MIHDREPVVVTRRNHEAVAMISLDEYNSITETLRLLRSPENARRLHRSAELVNAGGAVARDIDM